MIVVDTNIISYLYLTGEHSQEAEKLLSASPEWAAPLLWKSEFRNVLAHYIRKRILTMDESLIILQEAESLLNGNEYEVSSIGVMQLVSRSQCSAYDCEFVALARDLNTPFITADKKILQEFPETARSIASYLSCARTISQAPAS